MALKEEGEEEEEVALIEPASVEGSKALAKKKTPRREAS